MYWAAISLPRRPGPRPSRRSSARKRTWARIFSGSMEASAALTAGGMVWASALMERARNEAAREADGRMRIKFVLLCGLSLMGTSLEQNESCIASEEGKGKYRG